MSSDFPLNDLVEHLKKFNPQDVESSVGFDVIQIEGISRNTAADERSSYSTA